jgi:hypothetical protein
MLARVRSAIGDWGWFATALYAFDRASTRVFRGKLRVYFYRLEVQPVPVKPLLPPHRGRQFVIRALTNTDLALTHIPRPQSVIQDRFRQGGICLGAFQGEQLVGQLWMQFNAYREDEVRCLFCLIPPQKLAWDYDVFVDPQFRASFVFARLWDEAFNILRSQGIEWSASRVSAWNTTSLKSHARLGAREVGCALFFVIGKVQLTLANTQPFVHLSFSDAQVPHLNIAAPR